MGSGYHHINIQGFSDYMGQFAANNIKGSPSLQQNFWIDGIDGIAYQQAKQERLREQDLSQESNQAACKLFQEFAVDLLQSRNQKLSFKDKKHLKSIADTIKTIIPCAKEDEDLYYTFVALVEIIEQILDDDFMEFMDFMECDYGNANEIDIVAYGKGVEQAQKDLALLDKLIN